jgi:hypothetical protein
MNGFVTIHQPWRRSLCSHHKYLGRLMGSHLLEEGSERRLIRQVKLKDH